MFRGQKGKLARLNNILVDWKLFTSKFDIYHPTYYSYAIKKRGNIKTVITVFDMIHELYLSGKENFKNDILIKKKSIMSADHIICISSNTKKDLQEIYNIDDELISVIYLGSPLLRKKFIEVNCSIPGKPYILYVGKRGGYKNFGILLKAFYMSNLKYDYDLVCFGGGKFKREEVLEFENLKLVDSIKHVEGEDNLLQFHYENAHVFIYPSLYEGFGLPALEAMTFGCPVIASNASSIPEIVDNAALLFSPNKVEELSNCIKKIFNDTKIRNDYIEMGKKRCKDFSWEKTVLETFHLYQKLLN